MKVCGIMIAKKNSNRFPGKNRLLFEDNLKILINVCGEENTALVTNDTEIYNKCYNKKIIRHWRGPNATEDEQPYMELIRFAYMNLPKKYDYIVSILANTIDHTKNIVDVIKLKLQMMELSKNVTLMRSYNGANEQSGIFIFRTSRLPEKLYHEEMIYDSGCEIHYKKELE
jgi:hypothetical protein